jgi:hypothetical protein
MPQTPEMFVYGGMDAAVAIIPRCSEKMAFNVLGLRRFLWRNRALR